MRRSRTIWLGKYFIKQINDDTVVIRVPYVKEGETVEIMVFTLPSFRKAKGKVRVMSGRRVKIPRQIIKGEDLVIGVVKFS